VQRTNRGFPLAKASDGLAEGAGCL